MVHNETDVEIAHNSFVSVTSETFNKLALFKELGKLKNASFKALDSPKSCVEELH